VAEKQIKAIQEVSKEQVKSIQEATQKQVDAITESTKQQIETLVEQCQGIMAQQEKMVGVLVTMSEQNAQKLKEESEKRKLEEEKIKMLKIEQQRKLQQELDEKERLKPTIFVRIDTKSYYLFWDHYWVYLVNTGGNSRDVRVESIFLSSASRMKTTLRTRFESIGREQQQAFDCGNIDNFRAFDLVEVHLSVRDIRERKYVGNVRINMLERNWAHIPIAETKG
jgi:hypothetical protein